ncbi:MAG: hypothetical protein AAF938_13165 [Myxococcota bacterium]
MLGIAGCGDSGMDGEKGAPFVPDREADSGLEVIDNGPLFNGETTVEYDVDLPAEVVHRWFLELDDTATIRVATTLGTLVDSQLEVRRAGAMGERVAYDDDGGLGLASELEVTLEAGAYEVDAFAYALQQAGTFRLDATCSGPGCSVPDACEGNEGETIWETANGIEEDTWVWRLHVLEDWIVAATTTGLYRAERAGTLDFQRIQEGVFRAFAALPDGRWVVADEVTNAIAESDDEGESWRAFAHPFEETMYQMAVHPLDGTLYAGGLGVLARLDENGWFAVHGDFFALDNGRFTMEFDPATDDVWYGGASAIETPVLHRIAHPSGEAFSDGANLATFPLRPSTIEDVVFDASGSVLIGTEGGILRSDDEGETWTYVLDHTDDFRFARDIEFDPADPDHMFAITWEKEFDLPQPFIFYESTDGGSNWETVPGPADLTHGGGLSLAMDRSSGALEVYVGLFRGGVVRARICE